MALAGMRFASLSAGRLASSTTANFPKVCVRYSSTHITQPSALPSSRYRYLVLYRGSQTLHQLGLPRANLQLQLCKLASFSTSSSKATAVSNAKSAQSRKWRIIARVAFYLRIPFLVLSVYGIGYQQGIMDYSREPAEMESTLMDTVLSGVGCTSAEEREKVLVAREGEWRTLLARFRAEHPLRRAQDEEGYNEEHRRMVMMHNASIVGEKVVSVAKAYVKAKLTETVKEATEQMPPEIIEDEKKLYRALLSIEEVQLWTRARAAMDGSWRYVLIPTPIPNAFVSEILPHRIFITTSMFERFIESQDELALVLGHEISHLILGHSSNQNVLEASFRTLEILLLSLDPTEGILSLAFMSFLASVRHAIGAVYSRENERQADELGIKLTAQACYDTRAASHVFHKMHRDNVESGKASSSNRAGWGGLLSFFDTHPPSDERFQTLLAESMHENKDKYDESCASLQKLFLEALKPGDSGR